MPKLIKIKSRINCPSGFPASLASLLAQTIHPWLHSKEGPFPLRLHRCSELTTAQLKSREQVSFGVTSPSSMQRNVSLFSHEHSKGGAEFISSSRWMLSKSWNETRCLNPFPSKACLGLPVSSPLVAEPSLRRQASIPHRCRIPYGVKMSLLFSGKSYLDTLSTRRSRNKLHKWVLGARHLCPHTTHCFERLTALLGEEPEHVVSALLVSDRPFQLPASMLHSVLSAYENKPWVFTQMGKKAC